MINQFKRRSVVRDIASALAMSGLLATASLYSLSASAAEEEDGPRQPPATRSSEVLTERVFNAVNEINELLSPEEGEPNLVRAKEELDELNERYDRLNDFEKSTLLNFYTNYYLLTDNIQEALATFEKILTIENLRIES